MDKKGNQILNAALALLDAKGEKGGSWHAEPIAADGSQRSLLRLRAGSRRLVAIGAGPKETGGLAEAMSAWCIGSHLFQQDIAVPELVGFDPVMGVLLCEDLGNTRLHDLLLDAEVDGEKVTFCYRQAVKELARLQVLGAREFKSSWCWDTSRYDRQLMLERESAYFVNALCRDYLELTVDTQKLSREFQDLADVAAGAPAEYLLHRDFQCRNLMVRDGQVRIIDFQGARFGPLAYDLASLLRDPYAALPYKQQENFFEEYLVALRELTDYNPEQFRQEYFFLSLQRNLQILGAFAFLAKQRGKPFFENYIRPALLMQQELLAKPQGCMYPYLGQVTEHCLDRLDQIFKDREAGITIR